MLFGADIDDRYYDRILDQYFQDDFGLSECDSNGDGESAFYMYAYLGKPEVDCYIVATLKSTSDSVACLGPT